MCYQKCLGTQYQRTNSMLNCVNVLICFLNNIFPYVSLLLKGIIRAFSAKFASFQRF